MTGLAAYQSSATSSSAVTPVDETGSDWLPSAQDSVLIVLDRFGSVANAAAQSAQVLVNSYAIADRWSRIVSKVVATNALVDPFASYAAKVPHCLPITVKESGIASSEVSVIDFFRGARLQDLVDKLNSFSRLQVGWAGDLSEPPLELAIRNAERVIQQATSQRIWATGVFPADGSVFIRLAEADVRADIECENDGSVSAVMTRGDAEPEAWFFDEEDITADLSRIRAYFAR